MAIEPLVSVPNNVDVCANDSRVHSRTKVALAGTRGMLLAVPVRVHSTIKRS